MPVDLPQRAATVLALALLVACASPPPRAPGGYFGGRLLVRTDATASQGAKSLAGQFELSGGPRQGQLLLNSPIGTAVARARWRLRTPDAAAGGTDLIELDVGGPLRTYASLDDMVVDALGEQLPLAALFDWLAGRPWSEAPATLSADGSHFSQLGWVVDRSALAAERRIEAVREDPPGLRVRVVIDRDDPASASGPASPPPPP